jgi:hypothetical protein
VYQPGDMIYRHYSHLRSSDKAKMLCAQLKAEED